jgi:negative regulator of replication initiation
MKHFKIEVDEEVYKYLKGKAEPFVDSPNDVLRRELLKQTNRAKESKHVGRFPELPSGISAALQHTLEVTYLVKQKGISRPEATKIVANRHNIAPQTVLDKYCRQLDKKAYQIDRLLEDSNLQDFKKILTNKYPDHNSVIREFFNNLS